MGYLLDQDRALRQECIRSLVRHGYHETARLELEALGNLDTAKLAMPPVGSRERRASDAGVYYRPIAVADGGCQHLCDHCLPGAPGSVEYRSACCRPIHRSDLAIRQGPGPWAVACDVCSRVIVVHDRAQENTRPSATVPWQSAGGTL